MKKSFLAYQERKKEELVGTGLSGAVNIETFVRRVQVVRSMLQTGIPLTKLNYLRLLLETDTSISLTESSHMAQYVPCLGGRVQATEGRSWQGHSLQCNFDGSTRLGEALAILVRYVDPNWKIQQRLVRFHNLAKSVTKSQQARELITRLLTLLQIQPETLIAAVRDGAAVTGVAIRHMKDVLYPDVVDIICASNTVDKSDL